MTKDEKQVLYSVAIFIGVKVAIYIAIYYAAKVTRRI